MDKLIRFGGAVKLFLESEAGQILILSAFSITAVILYFLKGDRYLLGIFVNPLLLAMKGGKRQ